MCYNKSMKKVCKVAWSITHQEFTVTDYYYFSIIEKRAPEFGLQIDEVDNWDRLFEYDTIVFNYPEIPFTEKEVQDVVRAVEELGKKVILLGYYKNEDHIADTCNTLARAFGMELNPDEVIDEVSNYDNDKYFVKSTKIRRYNKGLDNKVNVNAVVLPCTCSIKTIMPDIKIVVAGEETAKSNMDNYPLLIADHIAPVSGGYFTLAGTCVFWDNYAIRLEDNLNFAMNMLWHETPPQDRENAKAVRFGL